MGRIVVVGCYIVGLSMFVERIPGAGETVRGRDFAEGPGGKGSNQAIAAARLGGDVAFLGCVGRDRYGDDGAACLRREGVDIRHLGRVDQPTATGFIIVDAEARNAISITEDASGALDDRRVDAAAEELLDDASVLLARWEMPLAPIRRAIALAHERGVRTIWNPAPSGALIVDGRQPRHVPTPTVDAVDTTGAGDAFNAALAVALAHGDGLDEAVHLACAAGAYSVLTAGTVASYPTRAELHAFMRSRT